jgi:hypothetical protein
MFATLRCVASRCVASAFLLYDFLFLISTFAICLFFSVLQAQSFLHTNIKTKATRTGFKKEETSPTAW